MKHSPIHLYDRMIQNIDDFCILNQNLLSNHVTHVQEHTGKHKPPAIKKTVKNSRSSALLDVIYQNSLIQEKA